jgi:hypothetical protein
MPADRSRLVAISSLQAYAIVCRTLASLHRYRDRTRAKKVEVVYRNPLDKMTDEEFIAHARSLGIESDVGDLYGDDG